MEKALSALPLVYIIGFSMGGCSRVSSSSSSPMDPSQNTVRTKDALVVGVEENFEPLSFYDKDGNLTGFAVESARGVTQELGAAVEFKTLSPSRIQQAPNNDEIDCSWSSYSKPTQQSESSNLTFDYMKNSQVMSTLADDPLNNLADLKDQRTGIKEGSGNQQTIEASTAFRSCLARLGTYQDYAQARSSLDSRGISAAIMDEVSAEYYLKQTPGQYRILGQTRSGPAETLETGNYSVAFRKADGSLTVKVQEALNELSEGGTISELLRQWFGTDLSAAPSALQGLNEL